MTRLTELRGVLAGSDAAHAAERWDLHSSDFPSATQTARSLRSDVLADRLHQRFIKLGQRLGIPGVVSSMRRYANQRRTLRELSALDDRMLSDIGIHRADIEATAALCCEETSTKGNSIWSGLRAWARREARRRRTLRELSTMPDALLADIGIERAEIPAIAAALAEAPREVETVSTGSAPSAGPGTTLERGAMAPQVLAFTQLRQSLRRAVNENTSRSSAA